VLALRPKRKRWMSSARHVSKRRNFESSSVRTIVKQRLCHLIRRPSGRKRSCSTAVECRGHAQTLRAVCAERVAESRFVKRNSSSLPSASWRSGLCDNLAPLAPSKRAGPSSLLKIRLCSILHKSLHIIILSLLYTLHDMR